MNLNLKKAKRAAKKVNVKAARFLNFKIILL
jgi:hypothetical protein